MNITKRLLLLFLVLALTVTPLCSCENVVNLVSSFLETTTLEETTLETTPEVTTPAQTTPPSSSTTPPSSEPEDTNPYNLKYKDMTSKEFYANYTLAENAEDAYYRSKYGFMSGTLRVPDEAPRVIQNRPMQDGKYIRNSEAQFVGEDVYLLVDVNGDVVMEIYRGGGYITLEEVAAYVYAFGDVPANYSSNKKAKPSSSIWGEYLRVNNTKFTGDTRKYPYEPELPRISGCGGDLTYYEIDIGTTGTTSGDGYAVRTYNNGSTITRGAARIVYTRYDRNGNQIIDLDERYVFYTYNHYNDFQEYLNYYGGWGEMFGNITGGGTLSSKSHYNPTPYVEVVRAPLPNATVTHEEAQTVEIIYFFCPVIDKFEYAA